jgi:flavin-dependent dehydrogenase
MAVASPGAAVRIALRDSDLVVERGQFAHLLASRAQEAGAELCYGYRFQGLVPHPAGATLHLRAADGQPATVIARAVIGADGLFSDVAMAAGLERPPAVHILQAEVRLLPGWDPAVTQVWFDADATRFFYWLIPESAEQGVVGLVGDDRSETRALLQRFLDRHGFQPLAYQGAQVAMHHPRLRPWGRVGAARVLLAGDAAGQVKVTTVGGTVFGLWGAAAAVRALLRDTPYAHELRPLKRELDLHWLIRRLLDRLDNRGYDRLLGCVTPGVQQFLGQHSRDAMAGVVWRMVVLQPGLVGLGLRLLVRGSDDRRLSHPVPSHL